MRETIFTKAERLFVVLTIFYYTGPVQNLFVPLDSVGHAGVGSEDYAAARLAWLPGYFLVVLLGLGQIRKVAHALSLNLALLALFLLPLTSSLWSVAAEVSLRRSVALLVSMLFGVYLAVRFRQFDIVRLLAWGLACSMVLSCIFVIAFPDRGIMSAPYEGAWQGMFGHKNALGRAALLSILATTVTLSGTRRFRWLMWWNLLISIVLLLASDSKTPLLVGIVLAGTGLVAVLGLRRPTQAIMTALFFATLAVVALANIDVLLQAFGRDATFTGRTQIWQATWQVIEQRFWLGYGYEAFWISPTGLALQVWRAIDWDPSHAHNGILELWLGIGSVGVALFAFVFVRVCIRVIHHTRSIGAPEAIWNMMFLLLYLLMGVTESVFIDQNDLLVVLFVATAVHWSRAGESAQRSAGPRRLVAAAFGRSPGAGASPKSGAR